MSKEILQEIYEISQDGYWDVKEGSYDAAMRKFEEIKKLCKTGR